MSRCFTDDIDLKSVCWFRNQGSRDGLGPPSIALDCQKHILVRSFIFLNSDLIQKPSEFVINPQKSTLWKVLSETKFKMEQNLAVD